MARVWFVVTVTIGIISLCQGQNLKDPYCTVSKGTPTTNTGPSLPTLLDTFQTQIEANFVGKYDNYSIDIEEYFDDEGNQGALRMVEDGTQLYAIYSYETNEFFSGTSDSDCTTTNLSATANNILLGYSVVNGTSHIFTTSGALRFGKQFGEKYMGTDQVRGINVDRWQSCVYWKSYNAYFTVDYYFTTKNWTSGIAYLQTPVRAWVQGVGRGDDGSLKMFNHYYDFFSFRPSILDMSVFETPKGVVCPGRIQTKSVPKLAGQYYYRQQIIIPSLNIVQHADVWFDSSYNLVRYDYRLLEPVAPYYDTNPFSEIHDYNSGVAYVIDRVLGNCTVRPVENSSFDVSLNYTQTIANGQYFDQMKTSLGLFYLDDTYSYEGQRVISGMACDVFISKRTDYTLGGIVGQINSTFEYYFLSSDWTEIANPGVSEDTTVPVRLEITIDDIGYTATYNFFDFDEEHPSMDNFDITPCYDDDKMIDFQLMFRAKYYPVVDKYKKFFELSSRLKISELTKISPIRVQRSLIKYEPNRVYYLASLLDSPPPSAQFHKYPKVVLENRNDEQIPNEGNPDNCAYYCLAEKSFNCMSFDVCPSKNLCYLSKSTADDGQLVDNDKCSHYSRNIQTNTFMEQASDEAFAALKDVVYRNLFFFDVPLGNGQKKTFRAVSVRENIIRGDTGTAPTLSGADFMKQFTAIRNKRITYNNDNKLTQLAVDDCATACVDEDLFFCESFEYNVANGDCFLSKINPSEHPDYLVDAQNVDLYGRSYLYKFSKSPGEVMLSQSNLIYQNIFEANQCAKLCVGLQEFSCKSFEFCEDIKGCVLGQTHKLDIPETLIKSEPNCDHYSRNYMDDFKLLKGRVIALTNNQIVEGVSLVRCAKICAEQGNDCLGFDYCGNDTMCRITSDSVKNTGTVTVETSAYCNHYSRQYYDDGSKVTAYSVKNAQNPNLKYSPGSMAGLAIAMLIIGILLAVGVSFGMSKYKGTTSWNPATKLENLG
ncbi:uncharacterized protein LOC135471113 [Liolophura sinensis]|uniref:uncharacterized protein LOC135471113 n=1 Tax=Liolophura sinensis TaxID=3198878 RepID=UPI003158A607